jgi:hypothetical protein
LSLPLDELKKYASSGNLQAANQAFFEHLGTRSLLDLTDGADLELVAFFLESVLPLTLNDHPSLILDAPELSRKYRALLREAEILGYGQEDLKRRKLCLRCLDAIGSVMGGGKGQVLLAAEENGVQPLLLYDDRPSGALSYETLEHFFREYFERAREERDSKLISDISAIVFDLISRLRREETVPGIVRGLFVDGLTGKGEVRRVLARVDMGEGSIEYAVFGAEEISESLKAAAQNAWVASNSYLSNHGYTEGLKGRKVTWQITGLDVKADELKTFYDGASMGFPLALAIISAYIRRPVPSRVAFTGAFDITSAREGRLVKVGGVVGKCKAAFEKGFKHIFLPQGNEADVDLSVQKEAEREGFSLSFVSSISQACKDLFGDSREKSAREIAREVISDLWGILTFKPGEVLFKQNLAHIWGSSLLIMAVYFVEGLMIYKTGPTVPVPQSAFYAPTLLACIIMFMGLLLCYGIVPSFLEQRRHDSWYFSIGILGVINLGIYFLFLQIYRGPTPDLSRFVDWPVSLGVLKDQFIFLAFSVLFLTNLFNYVGTLDLLSRRFQIITVQNCLTRPSLIDSAIPVKLLGFPWNWALIGILAVGAKLIIFEMIVYWSLKEGVEANRWFITLGILRDFIFLILAVEVLIWYRSALISIGRKVDQL